MFSSLPVPDDVRPLCDRCAHVVLEAKKHQNKDIKSLDIPHYSTPEQLSMSARSCSFCFVFDNTSPGWDPEESSDSAGVSIRLTYKDGKYTSMSPGTEISCFKNGRLQSLGLFQQMTHATIATRGAQTISICVKRDIHGLTCPASSSIVHFLSVSLHVG
jgi:hypothetical protein